MNEGNKNVGAMRITRARARALEGISASSRPSFKKGQGSKRGPAGKGRAVLTDVTNIPIISHDKGIKASRFQVCNLTHCPIFLFSLKVISIIVKRCKGVNKQLSFWIFLHLQFSPSFTYVYELVPQL